MWQPLEKVQKWGFASIYYRHKDILKELFYEKKKYIDFNFFFELSSHIGCIMFETKCVKIIE